MNTHGTNDGEAMAGMRSGDRVARSPLASFVIGLLSTLQLMCMPITAFAASQLEAQSVGNALIAKLQDNVPGANDIYFGFGLPVVNQHGDVVFQAVAGPQFSERRECIMFLDGLTGQLSRVMDGGDPMPGSNGDFEWFQPSALADDASIGFIGGHPVSSYHDTSGLFRLNPTLGTVTSVATEGDINSFASTPGAYYWPLSMNTNGDMVCRADFRVDGSIRRGSIRTSKGEINLITRRDGAGSSAWMASLNTDGNIAFTSHSRHGEFGRVPGALVAVIDNNPVILAMPGDLLPGDTKATQYRHATINDSNVVACTVDMRYPSNTFNNTKHVVLYSIGGGATPLTHPAMPAPSGGYFKSSTLCGFNNQNEVLIHAVMSNDSGEYFGLLKHDGVRLEVVALSTQILPGQTDLAAFYEAILNDKGQVLFTTFTSPPNSSRGLYLWDERTGPVHIIQTGDTIPDTVDRAVSYIEIAANDVSGGPLPSECDSLGGDGKLAFRFTLSGGFGGVISTSVVLPPRPVADIDMYHALDERVATSTNGIDIEFAAEPSEYLVGLDDVVGIAADGVATVALVYTTDLPGDANFVIESSDGLNEGMGLLQSTEGVPATVRADGSQHVAVETRPLGNGLHGAVALLRAPEEYVRPGALNDRGALYRSLRLQVYQGNAAEPDAYSEKYIRVDRPPVVLVHGLWASPETWDIAPSIRSAGFWVGLADYEATNASSFDVNDDIVAGQIWHLIAKYREQTNCSAAQAILACHSLGAVVTRRVIGGVSGGPYRSYLNRSEGTIDRFVPIAAPFHGGAGARLIVLPDGTPIPLLADLVSTIEGCVTCGAVRDLHPESAATRSLPSTLYAGVPTHAITGSSGREWVSLADAASELIGTKTVLERFVQYFAEILMIYQDIAFGISDHDMVVTLESQRGDLQVDYTTDFGFEPYPLFAGTHIGLPDEMRVASELVELFHLSLDDPRWANGLPPVPQPILPFFGGPTLFDDLGGLVIAVIGGRKSAIPGEVVRVEIAGYEDFQPVSIVVASKHDTQVADADGIATLNIPIDAPDGPFEIRALGRNQEDEYVLSDTLVVQVVDDRQAETFRVIPTNIVLSESNPYQLLRVIGIYDSYPNEKRLNPSVHEVSFTSSNESVVVVDSEGVITAVGVGVSVVTVSALGQEFTLSVIVDDLPSEGIACPADLDGSGAVGALDLSYLLAAWGQPHEADFNSDGAVDSYDLSVMISAWGPCSAR